MKTLRVFLTALLYLFIVMTILLLSLLLGRVALPYIAYPVYGLAHFFNIYGDDGVMGFYGDVIIWTVFPASVVLSFFTTRAILRR